MVRSLSILVIIISQMIIPQCVWAYVGPGAGISAIGTVVAFIGAILLAIVGFVWYPIKRLLRKVRKKEANGAQMQDEVSDVKEDTSK